MQFALQYAIYFQANLYETKYYQFLFEHFLIDQKKLLFFEDLHISHWPIEVFLFLQLILSINLPMIEVA